MDTILSINDLTVRIGAKRVIDGVSFSLNAGRITALVGESGSGKTMTALSILDLLPRAGAVEKGRILFRGEDILRMECEALRKIRGRHIGMVFQEPFTALNPLMRAGEQISETITAHGMMPPSRLAGRVEDLLETVRLSSDTASRYPHELSGGMRQRVMLAMALSCDPEILLLDEPTTALDVSVQKHVLNLIRDIQRNKGFAALFITHDLSVVNMIADDVCVMREGKIVEIGTKDEVLNSPKHPYTRHLLDCIPRLGDKRRRLPIADSSRGTGH